MKKIFLSSIVCLGMLFSCSSDDGGTDPGGGGGGQTVTATYRITFIPNFSQANFPTDYPADAMFSGIVVAVHAPDKRVFRVNQAASEGLKTLAETGNNAPLITDLNSQGGDDESDFFVTALSAASGPTSTQSVNIAIDPEKTSISFAVGLTPSPDWFVGIDNQSLIVNGNSLVTELDVNLTALDAGTDSGTTYLSADSPTVPQGLITTIDSPPIGMGGLSPTIGILRIERTDI